MTANFQGKVALVTGAGSGIGRDLVVKLHSLGAHVIAVSQTLSKLESLKAKLGDRCDIVSVDLGDWKATEKALEKVCGNVDFLVNNAGYGFTAPVDNFTEADYDKTMDINLKAPFNLIRLVSPGMKKRKFGSIVNISSVAGIAALDGHAIYAASKSGMDMLTKVSALELGPFNVRVNSINPTVVWTDMSKDYWSEPTRNQTMKSKIPMARFVEVSEVVEPIVFLLSQQSSMINGVLVPVDGGFVAT